MKWLVLKGRVSPRNRRRTAINALEVPNPAASKRRPEPTVCNLAPAPDNKDNSKRSRVRVRDSNPARGNNRAKVKASSRPNKVNNPASSPGRVSKASRGNRAKVRDNNLNRPNKARARDKVNKANNPDSNPVKAKVRVNNRGNRLSRVKVKASNQVSSRPNKVSNPANNLDKAKVNKRSRDRGSNKARARVKDKGNSKPSRVSSLVRGKDNSRVSKGKDRGKVRDNRPNKLSKVSSRVRVSNLVKARVRDEGGRSSRLNNKVSPASPVPKARIIAVRLVVVNALAISANDHSSIQADPAARIVVKKPPVRLLAINTRTGPTACAMSRR